MLKPKQFWMMDFQKEVGPVHEATSEAGLPGVAAWLMGGIG